MAQAENIDSGISNFQLDNRSGRDHHSLAHLSKFALSGAGAPARFHCNLRPFRSVETF